jgi:2-polyprenyl-3-methyl-5-hydroxy-6-metoxy-1,4-benzoquinol methylase
MDNPWAAILPILEQHGTSATVDEFHRQVNLHFHAVESSVYDKVHQEMWESLPPQFGLLAQDVLPLEPPGRKLRLLDIGCGTGLSSDLLLKTALGKRITDVCLLDTSQEMLDLALARSSSWGVRVEGRTGFVSDQPIEQFDVVLTCSVLHHIPFLPEFLSDISKRQGPGGILLHLQDPNRDSSADPQLLQRCEELRRAKAANAPSALRKLLRRWNPVRLTRRIINGPKVDYIAKVNQSLMDAGVLRSPLSEEQIWTITDIHDAPDQSLGISLREMRGWLGSYDLVSARSYGFFGTLVSQLPEDLAAQEVALRESNAPNGHFLSASWRKKSDLL